MRVIERYKWASINSTSHSSYEQDLPIKVVVSTDVEHYLKRQSYSSAKKLGGLLFGFHRQNSLYITMASSVGCSDWYQDGHRWETEIDERFVLGWSEAVHWMYGNDIDWIGNWIITPDESVYGFNRDNRIFMEGVGYGLYDDRNIFLNAGWRNKDFVITARRYIINEPGYEIAIEIGDFDLGQIKRIQ